MIYLVDEIIRSSNICAKDVLVEVRKFFKTTEFENSYKKWVEVYSKRLEIEEKSGPISMKEIIGRLDI